MKKTTRPLLVALLAILAGGGYWYFAANRSSGQPAAKAAPVPVTVATAHSGEMPLLLSLVGRAEAYESVTVKSRLDGQVLSVNYIEGQAVKQGDVLLRLDPGDFNARVLQAEAVLARDQAQLAKARADVERYTALKARGFVSDEKVNEVRTAEAAAVATVKADDAALELARLQLSYTTLRAPFDGVVGARLVFPGTAVKVNDTALAVVNRIKPLYVSFAVPERQLPPVRQAMADGPLTVKVALPGSKEASFEGKARFIDNAVDATTGTIQMKAVLDNREAKLTPGQFLNVSITLETLANAVLIPNEAIQQGAEGNFVYVAKADDTVEARKIETLASFHGQSAIASGIALGETVVTDGQLRLTPGTAIVAKGAGDSAAAAR
jgi:multidrug efflux system membrane fusion protein